MTDQPPDGPPARDGSPPEDSPPPDSPPGRPQQGARAGGRPPRPGGRDQVVADLDAHLQATRRELGERLDAIAADLAVTRRTTSSTTGLVAEALPRLADVAGEVAELRGRVDELAAAAPPDPKTPPVCWPALSAADADNAWNALAGWVADVVGPWYQLTRGQLPDCWALHRPVVLELSWLHTCWQDAYLAQSRPAAAAEWHARWRAAALANIGAAIPAQLCRPAPDRPGDHLVPQLDSFRDQPSNPYGPPPGTPAPPPAPPGPGRDFTNPADQVTAPPFWGPHLEQAKTADLDGRRRRATT